jgi:hypothetical protein
MFLTLYKLTTDPDLTVLYAGFLMFYFSKGVVSVKNCESQCLVFFYYE